MNIKDQVLAFHSAHCVSLVEKGQRLSAIANASCVNQPLYCYHRQIYQFIQHELTALQQTTYIDATTHVEYCVLFDHFLSTVVASECLTVHLPGFERVLLNLSNQVAIALTNVVVVYVNSSEPLSFIAQFLCG